MLAPEEAVLVLRLNVPMAKNAPSKILNLASEKFPALKKADMVYVVPAVNDTV
jgi:hypothetical protein